MEGKKKTICVGSRKSQLALIQTHYVMKLLGEKFPNYEFNLITMATTGDKILDTALSKIGEKSLFTKELEKALYDKSVSFVVHSLKDLPTVLPINMCLGAVLKREDPHDAVVMHAKHPDVTLDTLPKGSVIGTSSLRRSSQLKRKYPHLEFESIRGNLNTRLHKLDGADHYAAIILAAAGLKRMGWHDRISHVSLSQCPDRKACYKILDSDECMYAVSQGALAVECRSDDPETIEMLQVLHDEHTVVTCVAERAFLKRLEGGCSVPVACNSVYKGDNLYMKGGIYSIDGSQACEHSMDVTFSDDDSDEPPAKKRALGAEAAADKPREFAGIVANNMNMAQLHKAAELGFNLADKMLSIGGDVILKEAKEETAIEIQRRKDEWERTKLAEKLASTSKQHPEVVESLKKCEPTVTHPPSACPAHTAFHS